MARQFDLPLVTRDVDFAVVPALKTPGNPRVTIRFTRGCGQLNSDSDQTVVFDAVRAFMTQRLRFTDMLSDESIPEKELKTSIAKKRGMIYHPPSGNQCL